MKNYIISAAIILLAACNNSTDSKGKGDTAFGEYTNNPTTDKPAMYCFQNINSRDTATINLTVFNNQVAGNMRTAIYEKDARNGTLKGSIDKGLINVTWQFMQEGINDTLSLQFKMIDGSLLQKPLSFNTTINREQTDINADYTIKFTAVDCK